MDFSGSIVVGHDDTSASMAAVRWAAQLAEARSQRLCIVHAWSWPVLNYGMAGMAVMDSAAPRNQAQHLVDEAAHHVAGLFPRLPVWTEVIGGHPREVLDRVSLTAELLVVGTRGLGSIMGTLLGSVSRGILHDAGCPVAIIRSEHHRAGPVLVAYDGSRAARLALDHAADLANTWGDDLKIVTVVAGGHAPYEGVAESRGTNQRARSLLDEASAQVRARRPQVKLRARVLEDRTVPAALLTAAAGARVLVMGHRGLSRDRFGSVAHAATLNATGNLLIVRDLEEMATELTGTGGG